MRPPSRAGLLCSEMVMNSLSFQQSQRLDLCKPTFTGLVEKQFRVQPGLWRAREGHCRRWDGKMCRSWLSRGRQTCVWILTPPLLLSWWLSKLLTTLSFCCLISKKRGHKRDRALWFFRKLQWQGVFKTFSRQHQWSLLLRLQWRALPTKTHPCGSSYLVPITGENVCPLCEYCGPMFYS